MILIWAFSLYFMGYYRSHIFLCTNQRTNGKKSCQDADAEQMCQYLKKAIKSLGLSGKGGIRVSRSGCLGRCAEGPVLVIYPEEVWYTYQSKEDIDEILFEQVRNGRQVERLLLK